MSKKIKITERVTCDMCDGTGTWEGYESGDKYADYVSEECFECDGLGYVEVEAPLNPLEENN